MPERTFYYSTERATTRTLEEWADYISSPHYYSSPDASQHCGEVVGFFSTPHKRGFVFEYESGEIAHVTTRYMSNEKYMAIERCARMAVDMNVKIMIEGILVYDSFGPQIVEIERVWLGDDSNLVFRLVDCAMEVDVR